MVNTIFRAATIIPAKLATYETNKNIAPKFTITNVATASNYAISSSIISNPTQNFQSNSHDIVLLKETSINGHHHFLSPKEYELQHVVQKIKAIMASKAKGYLELEELIMVDVIQRLGLEDYFQEEIQFTLQRLRVKFCSFQDGDGDGDRHDDHDDDDDDKFYEVALSFRLLRQDGYHIPADIYNKLKDINGKFKGKLSKDVKALMSIFESCQLKTASEEILSEASNYCGQLLEKWLRNNNVGESQARVIHNTLRNPCHKSSPRLLANNFLHEFYDSLKFLHGYNDVKDDRWMNEVQELARIDFDLAHITYSHEIRQISRWAKELKLDKDLGEFARIQPFKWCMWSLGIIPGPNMSEERLELAKAVSFIYMIDDIFDSHPNYHHLCLFTQAVIRWEDADTKQLPKSMRVCFEALVQMTKDFSSKIQRKYGWNPEQCLRKLWGDQFEAYLTESKWNNAKYSPTPEEYLNNATVTSGTHVVLAHAFFLMGQGITNKSVQELSNQPSIISSTATILRLWNDAGIHTDRTPDGNDGSYIDWYMKEQKSRTLESARGHINKIISNAWQSLNEEYMSPLSPFSKDFKLACLNLARMVPIMYSHDKFQHLRYVMEH